MPFKPSMNISINQNKKGDPKYHFDLEHDFRGMHLYCNEEDDEFTNRSVTKRIVEEYGKSYRVNEIYINCDALSLVKVICRAMIQYKDQRSLDSKIILSNEAEKVLKQENLEFFNRISSKISAIKQQDQMIALTDVILAVSKEEHIGPAALKTYLYLLGLYSKFILRDTNKAILLNIEEMKADLVLSFPERKLLGAIKTLQEKKIIDLNGDHLKFNFHTNIELDINRSPMSCQDHLFDQSFGELLISISSGTKIDSVKARVFLYLISHFFKTDVPDGRTGPLLAAPGITAPILAISIEEYNQAIDFFCERKIIIRGVLDDRVDAIILNDKEEWIYNF